MPDVLRKLIPNRFFLIGWFAIVFGLIWIIKGGLLIENSDTLTIGIGFASIGLGFMSIGIAFHSMGQGKESDKKMDEITYVTFKDIIDRFEDNIWKIRSIQEANIGLTDQNHILQFNRGRKGLVYKCRNYIMWADRIKHRVENSEHNSIAQHLINLISSLDCQHDIRLIYEDARNLVSCYNLIWNFNIDNNRRQELSILFRERIADVISRNVEDQDLYNLVGEILSNIAPANTPEEMEPFDRMNLV